MNENRKYTFAIEINPVEEGRIYKRMPLHCTVMHWFHVAATPQALAIVARKAIEGQGSVELISSAAELYGPDRDIPVHSLVPVAQLLSLHSNLYHALNRVGVDYTHPEYVWNGYLPHVSTCDGCSFPVGSQHTAKRMYLAEALDEESPPNKIVRQVIDLN